MGQGQELFGLFSVCQLLFCLPLVCLFAQSAVQSERESAGALRGAEQLTKGLVRVCCMATAGQRIEQKGLDLAAA